MRVLVGPEAFGVQRYGGISTYFARLAAGLLQNGAHVSIFAGLYLSRGLAGTPHVYGVRVPFRPGLSRVNSRLRNPAIRWFRPDIYHQSFFVGESPDLRGARHVVTLYDLIVARFPHLFGPNASRFVEDQHRDCESSDAVICISERTRSDAIELFNLAPAKVHVTHLAVQPPSLAPTSEEGRSSADLLYVGSRHAYKGFAVLLRALQSVRRQIPKVRLRCVGGGPLTNDETSFMLDLGVSDVVQLERDAPSRLEELYRSCSLLVYPSLYEGFGIPPLEAMSRGLPVIATTGGSLPEVLGSAATLVPPNNAARLAEAITEVLTDPVKRERLRCRGQSHWGQYSWDATVLATLRVYRGLS